MNRWLIWIGVGTNLVATACVSQAPTTQPREAKNAPERSAAVTAPTTDTSVSAPAPPASSTSSPIATEDVAAAPPLKPRAAPSVPADLLREPLFAEAEQKRQDAERIARPVYQGDRNEKDMGRFIYKGEWAAWRKAKAAAIKDAAHAYARILELKPAPPSGWVVAVHARIGAMWGSFAEEALDIPMPDKRGFNPAFEIEWRNKLARDGGATLQANWSFQQCSKAARQAHIDDEHAQICEAWLAKHAPDRSR